MHSLSQSKVFAEVKATLYLAIPLIAAQLAQAATGFVDTVMMGLLGSETLAAGGLGAIIFFTLILICTGMVSAVGAIAATAHGAGELHRISHLTVQGLWLTVALSVPVGVVMWNLSPLLLRFGQDPTAVELAQSYLRALILGFPAALGFAVLRNILSALNYTRPIMAIVASCVPLNIGGNYVLMFGKFGLPALGLAGIGWASTLSFWVTFIAAAGFLCLSRRLKPYQIFRTSYQFDASEFWGIVKIGWPIAGLFAIETGLFAVTTFMMGTLGTVTLAAHNIALQTANITFMVPVGLSLATTVRVGQAMGRKEILSARLAGYVGIAIGVSFMSLMGLFLWTNPDKIVALYLDIQNAENQPVLESAMSLLGIAAMFQIFDGMQIIAAGALRGVKDTRIPMAIGFLGYWCIGLFSGYILGLRLNFGGTGLWLGLVLGLAFSGLLLTCRFAYLLTGKTDFVE
ncbi:MATE family efflux transporter [Laspinema olomoucense]|uniref:MATE family efflux transporter n=1 Tax=Laspinema olomoucense TaxID=3231600 RepID=UPI0021BB22D7|nr:MATE family efflux transporter [Laspinema sp. D3a]MCT7991723.1 MATE family efflux transporter [Laspinema sp. D3a]